MRRTSDERRFVVLPPPRENCEYCLDVHASVSRAWGMQMRAVLTLCAKNQLDPVAVSMLYQLLTDRHPVLAYTALRTC